MSGLWEPLGSAATYLVWDCKVNTNKTKPAPGAGDDETEEGTGGECNSSNAPLTPDDVHFQDRIHFSLESTAEDIELTVGTSSQKPDYTLNGVFYLDNCAFISGTEYCDITLTALTLSTDSSMAFGSTTVTDAKVRLAEAATTTINMSTGSFSFSTTGDVVVGVSWEESGTTHENSVNIDNGSDDLSGTLSIGGMSPTISFNGTFSPTGGSLDLDNVVTDIVNEMPDADSSNTYQTVTCIPSAEDASKTWIELDGSASSDPESNIAAWVWYVDDEIVGEDEITDILLAPGTFDVLLLVYDDLGSWSSTDFSLQVLSGSYS